MPDGAFLSDTGHGRALPARPCPLRPGMCGQRLSPSNCALGARPSTFNGLEGDAPRCTLCPTGHVCPGWSRTQPERCPAGYVCNALGQSQPVLTCPEGYFCGEGTLTLDPADPTPLRPQPCPPGPFVSVVSRTISRRRGFPSSQVAFPPAALHGGNVLPGRFSDGDRFANVLRRPLLPARFHLSSPSTIRFFFRRRRSSSAHNVFSGHVRGADGGPRVRRLPRGYSCQGYGTYEPKICEAGTYRSLADSVTCRLCPPGTYSTVNGSTDISSCLPCPEGRVCGDQGMFNLTASDRCPEGHLRRGHGARHDVPAQVPRGHVLWVGDLAAVSI